MDDLAQKVAAPPEPSTEPLLDVCDPPHSTLNCHTTMLRRLLQSQDLQINAYTRVCATIGCCDCLPRQGDDCHREDTCYDSNFTIALKGCE